MGSKYNKLVYDYRKKLGKCTSCGNDAVEGKTRCRKCLDIASNRQREKLKRETEEQRDIRLQRNREYQKKRTDKLISSGICVMCGKKPICFSSNRYCVNCLEKNNNRVPKIG